MAKTGRPPKLLEIVTIQREKTHHNEDGSHSIEWEEKQVTVAEAIVIALHVGAYLQDAAEGAGVSESAIHKWIARGKEHRPDDGTNETAEERMAAVPEKERIYVNFVEAVEKARAESVLFNLSAIRVAARTGSWQAAAWWLERTRPKQFGRRQAVELSGEVKTPVGAPDLSKLSLDEARELQALLEKAAPSRVEA